MFTPEELEAELAKLQTSVDKFEYRLYYNEHGNIYECSMINHRNDGQYLIVDKKTYDNYFRYRVKNQQLEKIEHDLNVSTTLRKDDHGYPVVKGHAGLLILSDEDYPVREYYATKAS